ncbi:MAG: hypothetical protein IJ068_00540 [Bacilli bacterium]|nr:hypothetical protein [Bacilli bacterium]
MEKEYYLGYLRNPKDVITNGFQDVKETEAILYKDVNDYREVVTNEKVLEVSKNQVFDGHRVTEAQAGFIGRIGEKLELKDTLAKMNQIRENNMASYVEKIYQLIIDTRELANIGEQEYLNEIEKFQNSFRK